MDSLCCGQCKKNLSSENAHWKVIDRDSYLCPECHVEFIAAAATSPLLTMFIMCMEEKNVTKQEEKRELGIVVYISLLFFMVELLSLFIQYLPYVIDSIIGRLDVLLCFL